jgi:hypothetical protein
MDALKDICKAISDLLRKHMPTEHSDLSVFCELLPMNHMPATYPFPGCVLNVQVSTLGHKDGGDTVLCGIIPFGEFEDGDIVLWEAGLRIQLKEGTGVFFPSSEITHFNMPFKGVRCAVVLHCDKEGKSWVEDRNGWEDHMALFE